MDCAQLPLPSKHIGGVSKFMVVFSCVIYHSSFSSLYALPKPYEILLGGIRRSIDSFADTNQPINLSTSLFQLSLYSPDFLHLSRSYPSPGSSLGWPDRSKSDDPYQHNHKICFLEVSYSPFEIINEILRFQNWRICTVYGLDYWNHWHLSKLLGASFTFRQFKHDISVFWTMSWRPKDPTISSWNFGWLGEFVKVG